MSKQKGMQQRIKIWFIDDFEGNLRAWKRGFPPKIAQSCELRTFLRWNTLKNELERNRLPDILFLDYFLAETYGSDILHWMQQNLRELPVIVAHSSVPQANQKMLALGAHCALKKYRGEEISSPIQEHFHDLEDIKFLLKYKKIP
ncbi:MAG: response regulator [Planctomycetota bacterium]|nr:MAG: response regulator [Planctomycetota bacterium]